MTVSIIIPAYNAADQLPPLVAALSGQVGADFETILVDDGSKDSTAALAEAAGWRVLRMAQNQGPAACRNAGVAAAKGEMLVFTDADCRPESDWMARLIGALKDDATAAVMGRVCIESSNILGQAISALGFPAGGSTGFEKIWPVDPQGFTISLSTCNCAIKRSAFEAIGGFDIDFPFAGGEDSLLSYRLIQKEQRIRFCPEAVVWHPTRDRWIDFIRWQFKRGASAYIFSTKVERRGSYLSLRLWSTRNIIKTWAGNRLFPLIMILWAASVAIQSAGFFWKRRR